ncbi:hypothetical protein A2U01_0111005, partial [Trifolium medium]|nr:hypothetical protein [Trifolium medium]
NVASKHSLERSAAPMGAARSNQQLPKLQTKHFEFAMAHLEPIPTKPNLKQHTYM